MSSYEDRFVKIRVVFQTHFISKTKSVSLQFFCISDKGNSLSDCSKSMEKICIADIFRTNVLKQWLVASHSRLHDRLSLSAGGPWTRGWPWISLYGEWVSSHTLVMLLFLQWLYGIYVPKDFDRILGYVYSIRLCFILFRRTYPHSFCLFRPDIVPKLLAGLPYSLLMTLCHI